MIKKLSLGALIGGAALLASHGFAADQPGARLEAAFKKAGQQDLKLYIDNKPMSFDLTTPATNACGVVVWSPTLMLSFHVHAEQENGRVHSWDLKYVKGIDPTRIALGSAEYPAGQSPVDVDVNGNVMLVEPVTPSNPTGQLQSTCAFALLLNAWLHCRGDWGWIYAGEKAYAIAVEKCPPCTRPDSATHSVNGSLIVV